MKCIDDDDECGCACMSVWVCLCLCVCSYTHDYVCVCLCVTGSLVMQHAGESVTPINNSVLIGTVHGAVGQCVCCSVGLCLCHSHTHCHWCHSGFTDMFK